jgi:DNA excision repair protein ERCC-3
MIHGKISNKNREIILDEFRSESGVNILLMTKVGDISIDIPNANVIIQISSHFASRMQEAQRFGRILRPKKDIFSEYNAFFYTVVSKNTNEMTYSNKRHRFLVDQGYYFSIINDIGNIFENKSEKERKEILERFKKDESYEEYIIDTYKEIEEKIYKKEKVVNDFNDEKDTHEILNEEIDQISTDIIE